MSPNEIFEHRLASLLGLTIGELLELPEREIRRWQKYWALEPWGPLRDNMHTAMLCMQVLRPHLPKNSKLKMDDFMLKDGKAQKRKAVAQFVAQLGAAAARGPKRKK